MTPQPRQTPFYDFHVAAGGRMVEFAGFQLPIQYTSINAEHQAVRQNVGMFDLSHMGEFEVSGSKALDYLQRVTTNNVAALDTPGKIQYSCMPLPTGGIVDDLLVYRLKDKFMLVVNASNIEKDFKWLSAQLEPDVELRDVSTEIGLLAVQGPHAHEVVAKLTKYNLNDMPYYTSAVAEIAGVELLFSRTGYTGEDGFEIYIPTEKCDTLWNALMEAGKKYDMTLIGLGARDTLRMEMKMALYGNDIDETTTPVEAGLSWIVYFDKEFIGKDVIVAQKEEKPSRRLICLEMDGRNVPRHEFGIFAGSDRVGHVTSGTFSPSLQKPIAIGYVSRDHATTGSMVEIDIRGKRLPATVVKPPFYKQGSHK